MPTVTIDSNGRIQNADGLRIGEILATENTIKKIEIDPPYQNEGYGTEAIKAFAESCVEDGYDVMYVACITNKHLTKILKKFGGEEISSHQLPISPHPMLEPDKPDYKLSLPLN